MPRYFFDVTVNGSTETDEEGVLFADIEGARHEASRVAGEMAAEPNGPEKDVLICMRSEKGRIVLEIELRVVIRNLTDA